MDILDIIKQSNRTTIIMDFDHTITTYDSNTSISVFSEILSEKYTRSKYKIDEKVNKENSKISLYYLWLKKIFLLKKFNANEYIKEASKYFKIRPSFFKIYLYCIQNNIKLIIVSSGYKPLINYILKNNNIINVEIIGNEHLYHIVTPFNKYKFIKKNYYHPIIIGDNIMDKFIVKDNDSISIGICNNLKEYELYNHIFDYVILGDIKLLKKYKTSKNEVGIIEQNSVKYFYKKFFKDLELEKNGYNSVKGYFLVSPFCIKCGDLLIYDYIEDFKKETINDYLYGSINNIDFEIISKQYNFSINKTLKLEKESNCLCVKYFKNRLCVIESNKLKLENKYLLYNNKKYNLEEIFNDISENIIKDKEIYAFISQGDPTDTNITSTGYFTDFENGGYNSILGEISIIFVSLFSHGRYFYPKYNRKAYVINKSILKKYNDYKFDIDYKIEKNVIKVNSFDYNIPIKNKKMIKEFIDIYLKNKKYSIYKCDFNLLKYYICMRMLTPINIDEMDIDDKIIILILVVIMYENVDDLKSLEKFIN